MRVLDELGIPYTVRPHAHPAFTVEGVARERGVRISQVVKAMLVQRSDGGFVLAVIPGHRRLSLKKLSLAVGDKRLRLASERDVARVTGYRVGAVSPLGLRRQDVNIYVDKGILEEPVVDISAGRPDAGLELRSEDLVRALNGQMGDFSE